MMDVHQILWKSYKKCDKDPDNDQTSVWGRKHEPYRPKKGETSEKQSQELGYHFSLTSRELFLKNWSWQSKQSIPHTTMTFYSDCMKICEDFALKFGDKRTGFCMTTTHHLTLPFSPGNFLPKTT
jgi:hypothetical protein